MLLPLLVLLSPLQTTPAPAPAPAEACPARAEPVPAELSGWKHRVPLAAGAVLKPGEGADLTLRPVAEIDFLIPPKKPAPAGSYAGQFTFRVTKAGTIRVALGAGAWIDVARAGNRTPLVSTAHGHGPACSGIRKIVNFKVTPGNYLMVLSGSTEATLPALITVPR